MISLGRPTFEVVTPAEPEDRRLVSVETIRAMTGIPEAGDGALSDTDLARILDAELSRCARSCKLAPYRTSPPTLALEAVRATWLPATTTDYGRYAPGWSSEPSRLLLPWRAPIVSIEVTEGEADLVENTDFRVIERGMLERIGAFWGAAGAIVVDYTAGFVPLADDPVYQEEGEPLPADVVALLADQVRMSADRRDIDLNLRSENVPDIWAGSYNVAGGSAIDTKGLLMPLYEILGAYRAPASIG